MNPAPIAIPDLPVGHAIAHTATSIAGKAFAGRWEAVHHGRRLLNIHYDALYREADLHRDVPGLLWALSNMATNLTQLHAAVVARDAVRTERAISTLAVRGAVLAGDTAPPRVGAIAIPTGLPGNVVPLRRAERLQVA